jgi:hypothetical protein
VVDLFDPPHKPDQEIARQAKPSERRIKKNVTFWPKNLIQSVIEKVEPGNLKYVCLFINKRDLLESYDSAIEEEIKHQYRDMWKSIFTDISDVECELIIGSADKNIGTANLLSKLIEVSAPPGPGYLAT